MIRLLQKRGVDDGRSQVQGSLSYCLRRLDDSAWRKLDSVREMVSVCASACSEIVP